MSASTAMPFSHTWARTLPVDGRLTSTDLAVGRVLALHMDASGGSCWPTHSLVAYETRLAERTVRLAVSNLLRFGWLEQTARSAPGRAATYRAAIPTVPEPHRTSRNTGMGMPPNTGMGMPPNTGMGMPPSGQHRHGDAAEHRHMTTGTPAWGCRPGSHQVSNNRERAQEYDADFARVWSSYPKKVAKHAAHKAYVARRRAGVGADELLAAVEHYAAERAGEDPRYTLHASTFFGPGERWREVAAPETYAAPDPVYR